MISAMKNILLTYKSSEFCAENGCLYNISDKKNPQNYFLY